MYSRFIVLIVSVVLTGSAMAQFPERKIIETQFWVGGTCEMCKERIETTLDVKGVKSAEYDLDAHQLALVYNTKHITLDEIHALLNAVGHDTESSKSSDEEYDKIHSCCKYRSDEGQ